MWYHHKTEQVGTWLSLWILIPYHKHRYSVANLLVCLNQMVSNDHFLVLPVHQIFPESSVTIMRGKDL
jgi:hypothetical protein